LQFDGKRGSTGMKRRRGGLFRGLAGGALLNTEKKSRRDQRPKAVYPGVGGTKSEGGEIFGVCENIFSGKKRKRGNLKAHKAGNAIFHVTALELTRKKRVCKIEWKKRGTKWKRHAGGRKGEWPRMRKAGKEKERWERE